MLLPVDEYLPGAVLPPHLSPFVETTEGGYVPPEKKRLINMKLGITDEQVDENQKAKDIAKIQDSVEKKEKVNKQNATSSPVNGNGKKHQEETKLKKNEKRKNEESDEDENEDEELLNDMKVDLDSPDEEQSEEESEDFSDNEEAEEASKKNINQVTDRIFFKTNNNYLLSLVEMHSETNYRRG